MKKIIMLAGIAAAVFGAKKLLGGKKDEDTYNTDISTPANGYAPQPQS